MSLPTGAGSLTERVRFERRSLNARGDAVGAWTPHMTVWAGRANLMGGETFTAQRMAGVQPASFWIRMSRKALEVTQAFRIVDIRTGQAFDIVGVTPRVTRDFIDILVRRAPAAGGAQ